MPSSIKHRKAYFVDSGIGNLIAAGYLLRDGQMPGENITFLEQLDVAGGFNNEPAKIIFYPKQY
ncbi:oleate hydratase [Corynebacterium pseudokroppenstedtii]|uniref:oleate hydratase n=1 Tax=Corynebacterium pseudokroppenstedtii TaxID=2804917 RepID=UPI003078F1EF